MSKEKQFNLIWTLIFFTFVTILAFIFQNANVLWLLILWVVELET